MLGSKNGEDGMWWSLVILACIGCAAPVDCRDAVAHVQRYKAPGQAQSVGDEAKRRLATDARPARMEGWRNLSPTAGRCGVVLQATIGNESRDYVWSYDPQTGRVEAIDDATKRLSGW